MNQYIEFWKQFQSQYGRKTKGDCISHVQGRDHRQEPLDLPRSPSLPSESAQLQVIKPNKEFQLISSQK